VVTFAERFGRNLAEARRPTGLSQEELGFRAGMHRTAVGQLERGERTARLDSFIKLADSLGVEPATLLRGLSWNPTEVVTGQWSAFGDATL
jgi:transcriptional regulator with XRE-family HTH domain